MTNTLLPDCAIKPPTAEADDEALEGRGGSGFSRLSVEGMRNGIRSKLSNGANWYGFYMDRSVAGSAAKQRNDKGRYPVFLEP